MQKTLKEISQLINGKLIGDGSLVISGLSGIKEAQKGQLTFLANPKYLPLIKETKASAVVVGPDVTAPAGLSLIVVNNPSLAFSQIAGLFIDKASERIKGIHPSAVISKDAKLAKDVAVGPLAVIEAGVTIGAGTAIHAGSFVGANCVIGSNSCIYPNVTILHHSIIGSNVIIHSGTVVGSDGFGYEFVDGAHQKIPQIGYVEIADDVEIGANVTIDRARFDKTYIGKGTKIDNLVQIAHNVIIEENCIIVAQVGISGSSRIEKNSILAGQVGIVGHSTIGAGSIVAAQSGVSKSIPPGSKVLGSPAIPINEAKRSLANIARLPHYVNLIVKLTKRVEELEDKLKNKS